MRLYIGVDFHPHQQTVCWFEDLIFENGPELLVGDPALIRKRAVSRHKSDKRDAEHIYTLLGVLKLLKEADMNEVQSMRRSNLFRLMDG